MGVRCNSSLKAITVSSAFYPVVDALVQGGASRFGTPPTLVEGSIFLIWYGNMPNYWQTTAVPYSRLWHTAGLICHIHTNKMTRSDVFYFGATEGAMVIAKELAAPTKPAPCSGR